MGRYTVHAAALYSEAVQEKIRYHHQDLRMTRCALVYDFDGTLSEGNCAEHGLMQAIGIKDSAAFWKHVHDRAVERDGDEILTYLGELALQSHTAGCQHELSPFRLAQHGQTIPLFPGVADWFETINDFANSQGLTVEHFIVSSGLEDMIRGTSIAPHFRNIFGCRYHYDVDTGHAMWPATTINYTTKTQYLFRINKGVENSWDSQTINKYIDKSERAFPFDKMIYFGDGDTDIPSMKLVKEQGGCSIAVFDSNKWARAGTREKIEKLIAEDRVNYVVPGDYSLGSQLDVTVRGILRMYRLKYS